MKIAFYSPYIPNHFGGGEKHFFDVANVLASDSNNRVTVLLPEENDFDVKVLEYKSKYESFLNYSLDKINFIPSPFPNSNFFKKLLFTNQFDCFYYVTDGSLFFSLAKKNILHLQIPFLHDKSSFIERLKLSNWSIKNANSLFTKEIVEKSWNTKIDYLLYPKVSLKELENNKNKEKIILNVGRFFRQLHNKRQDVLIDIFKSLCDQESKIMKDYKLVLIGSVEDQNYFEELKQKANGYNVIFETNLNRKELIQYYQKSKIYWHATGFEIDPEIEPEKVEHFGITTIEAVGAGALPIVHNKGGQKEIIGDIKELLWLSKDDCFKKTLAIISDEKLYQKLYTQIRERINLFSEDNFTKVVKKMFE